MNVKDEDLPADRDEFAALDDSALLTEPETLGDDVLESALYLLRERLRGNGRP